MNTWHSFVDYLPTARRPLAALGLVLALACLLPRPVWRWTRTVPTIVHEGGHALIAVLTGRRLTGIRLHADTSGLTLSRGKARGPGMVATFMAGYPAASVLGIGGALLLAAGDVTVMLWTAIVALLAMLVMVRNAFGVLALLVTGAIVFVVSWYAPAPVQAVFGYLVTWFLLLGGVRPVFEVQHDRRRGRARDSDVDQLARLTGVAGTLWVGLFALFCLGALGFGGYLLLR